jgi:putative hemolysin
VGFLLSMGLQTLGFVISLFLCAVFSFLETSITALRLFKLKELSKSTDKYRDLFDTLEKNPQRILITILIVSSLANATSAALISQVMTEIFSRLQLSEGIGFSLGIFVATAAILIFGEVIPKHLARSRGTELLKSGLWLTNMVYFALHPAVKVLNRISDFITSKIGGKIKLEEEASEQEIQFLIDYIDEKGLMEPEKTKMLQSIFEIGTTPIKEIMIPGPDIIKINIDGSTEEALKIFTEHQLSRLPVYKTSPNNIIGMLHQKDLFLMLQEDKKLEFKELVRQTIFAPESMKVNQLLREFKEQHKHMAMVLNEHGDLVGLVTLEDVLEEIVGEISDEYESESKKLISIQQNSWIAEGSIGLEDLSKDLGIEFKAEGALTLGGFLTEKFQHLPVKGEKIIYKDYTFQIQKASQRRIFLVLIFKNQ